MNRDDIEAFFVMRDSAWQRHDVEALLANHAETGEVQSPVGGNVKGLSAIEEIYKGWFTSFPDARYTTEHLLIDGDRAVQIVIMTGNHSGSFCGLAPTGKRFMIRCAFLFSFAAGKIAQEIRIYDFTSMLLQLGVLAAKPAF